MRAPPGFEPFTITYEKDGDGDLPQIIDIIRPLRVNVIVQNAAALRHTSLDTSHYHPRSHYTDSPLDVPTTGMREMRKSCLVRRPTHCTRSLTGLDNVICVVFDRKDADMRRRVQWLVRTMIQDCADNGWAEFRTHIGLMDQVAMTYDFNDHALMKLNETIKNALDPKGILAPGKSGVWPQTNDEEKGMLGDEHVK